MTYQKKEVQDLYLPNIHQLANNGYADKFWFTSLILYAYIFKLSHVLLNCIGHDERRIQKVLCWRILRI